MRATTLVVVCAGLLGASSFPATHQDPQGRRSQDPQNNGTFVLEAGEHPIADLIDRSAKYLGRNYLYSQGDLLNAPDAVAKLQHRLELDAVGCEAVVAEIAYTLGFAMLPIDEQRGLYEWIFRQGPKRIELASHAKALEPDQVLAKRGLKIQVLTSIPLQHINAIAAQNQLRPFFLSGGGQSTGSLQFGVVGQSLLVQGFADQVAAVIEIIRKVDTPPALVSQAQSDWRDEVEQRLQELEEKVGK